jgi:MFS family permease
MSLSKDKKDNFAALRFPEFRSYVLSRFFFIIVLTMQATIISWKVYELTRDTFSIGMLGLVEFTPAFMLAFYSGYVIDKGDKRNLLLSSMIGNVILTSILCFITSNYAISEYPQTWILFIIFFVVFGIGVLRPFTGPTSFALVSQLVPKHDLANATMWNSASWQVGAVTGPALAGLMYGLAGITNTFYLMIGMMGIAITGLSLVTPKPVLYQKREESIVESVKQGFRFVWKSKEVLGAMSLDLFAVLFGGATALLPAFADKILHVGAQGLGVLRSAPAIGGVTVLALLAFRPLHRHQGKIMLASVAGFGICIIVFGLSQIFWLSFFALFASGMLDGISVIVRSTILQLKTPDAMKGRVASLNSIFVMSSNELGSFESGVTSKLMGNVAAVVFGGCMTIGVVVYNWFKSPSLRKLEY